MRRFTKWAVLLGLGVVVVALFVALWGSGELTPAERERRLAEVGLSKENRQQLLEKMSEEDKAMLRMGLSEEDKKVLAEKTLLGTLGVEWLEIQFRLSLDEAKPGDEERLREIEQILLADAKKNAESYQGKVATSVVNAKESVKLANELVVRYADGKLAGPSAIAARRAAIAYLAAKEERLAALNDNLSRAEKEDAFQKAMSSHKAWGVAFNAVFAANDVDYAVELAAEAAEEARNAASELTRAQYSKKKLFHEAQISARKQLLASIQASYPDHWARRDAIDAAKEIVEEADDAYDKWRKGYYYERLPDHRSDSSAGIESVHPELSEGGVSDGPQRREARVPKSSPASPINPWDAPRNPASVAASIAKEFNEKTGKPAPLPRLRAQTAALPAPISTR